MRAAILNSLHKTDELAPGHRRQMKNPKQSKNIESLRNALLALGAHARHALHTELTNFCAECGAYFHPDALSECYECGEKMCLKCSKCACGSAAA
jgi:hypothetical protein